MKSQRGITLTSLVVYIVGITILVSVMAIITTNFYKTMNDSNSSIEPYVEYTKFNTYFTEDINKGSIKILDCDENYIAFNDEVQYTYVSENKGIYKNKVKICKNVTSCRFTTEIKNGKEIVKIELTIGDKSYTNSYTLKN